MYSCFSVPARRLDSLVEHDGLSAYFTQAEFNLSRRQMRSIRAQRIPAQAEPVRHVMLDQFNGQLPGQRAEGMSLQQPEEQSSAQQGDRMHCEAVADLFEYIEVIDSRSRRH